MPAITDNAALDDLARRHRAGDAGAFDLLVEATESEVRIFLMARTRVPSEVEEALQAAYVAVFEHIADYEARGTLLSWIKGIARNRLLELWRERQRVRSDPLDEALDSLWEHADEDRSADVLRQELGALQRCLGRLDQRSRDLLEHHHVGGLPLNDLARRYRRPRTVIAKLLFGLRRQLRDCIDRSLGQGAARA